MELQELRSNGDEVLVPMVWQTDESTGGAALGAVFHVVRVAGEEITRMRVFVEEAAALEAVGLSA